MRLLLYLELERLPQTALHFQTRVSISWPRALVSTGCLIRTFNRMTMDERENLIRFLKSAWVEVGEVSINTEFKCKRML